MKEITSFKTRGKHLSDYSNNANPISNFRYVPASSKWQYNLHNACKSWPLTSKIHTEPRHTSTRLKLSSELTKKNIEILTISPSTTRRKINELPEQNLN